MRRRYRIRFIRRNDLLKLILIAAAAVIAILLVKAGFTTGETAKAKKVAEEFYTYESEGKFADSWEMFHPLMKKRFSKGHYLQDRAHVFMNHFGVTTFTFSAGRTEKVKNWMMAESAEPFDLVYKTEIIQTYKGKYGNFDLVQDVFVTKEDGEWTVLWDYNQ